LRNSGIAHPLFTLSTVFFPSSSENWQNHFNDRDREQITKSIDQVYHHNKRFACKKCSYRTPTGVLSRNVQVLWHYLP
jgi:hypothetical protein